MNNSPQVFTLSVDSAAPALGSPESLIENGFVLICQGIFQLEKAGRAEDAQHELARVVNLFLADKMRLIKKTGKII